MRKRAKYCEFCREERSYNHTFDAGFCKSCDIWLEPDCGCLEEEECGFKGRPDKPSEAPSHPFDN